MNARAMSPSVASGCVELLGAVSRGQLTAPEACALTLCPLPSKDIVDAAFALRWLDLTETGQLAMTLRGEQALDAATAQASFRHLIMDYIDAENPPWVQLAPRGRMEVLKNTPSGIRQLLVEADLGYGDAEDIVAFWDALAARARGLRGAALAETGRRGERLTLAYECARTGVKPKWISLDSNAEGYDVLSRVSGEDSRRLTIEVKASTQRGLLGSFHLSRNEWEMAEESRSHKFHLWDLSRQPPHLAALDVDQVIKHMPDDAGEGRWESTMIPFAAFSGQFQAV